MIFDIDAGPEWSHNGQWIAYRRRFSSTDGPPGLYIILAAGGKPRFLAAGDFFDPHYLRFSPDDRFLACVRWGQLLLVELATGNASQPMYSDHGVAELDWSPDGSQIAYRPRFALSDDPPESLGLHILDLPSGMIRFVSYQGQVQDGAFPVWSKDGKSIVFTGGDGIHSIMYLLAIDGSSRRTLLVSPETGGFGGLIRYVRTARGLDGLVFGGYTPIGVGTFFIGWDGSALQRIPRPYQSDDAHSPDGSLGAGSRINPKDSVPVLFVFSADDITGATYRQLTYYQPPSTAANAPARVSARPPPHNRTEP